MATLTDFDGLMTSPDFTGINIIPPGVASQEKSDETDETDETDEDEAPGLECELKTFEARYNSKGERVVLSVGTRKSLGRPMVASHDSALVLTRFYDRDRKWEYTQLEIQSPYIRKALQTVVSEYPGLNIKSRVITMRNEPMCLFHYRSQLQAYADNHDDQKVKEHVFFALQYMNKTLQKEIFDFTAYVEHPLFSPMIDHAMIWMLFKPGDYCCFKEGSTNRMMQFKRLGREKHTPSDAANFRWKITGVYIDYDGYDFGHIELSIFVDRFDDFKFIADLRVFPISYHPQQKLLVEQLALRGARFVSFHGKHHCMYNASASTIKSNRKTNMDDYDDDDGNEEENDVPEHSLLISSRVMVDRKGSRFANGNRGILYRDYKIYKVTEGEHSVMTSEELQICNHEVAGYSLLEKRWCWFHIDFLSHVEYNVSAFDTLQLPEAQKDMILSLVKVHTNDRLSFDDVIKGKGKGMVFLLHGPTGVGKTLTAESVADFCYRPLYTITAGDIGTTPSSVERALSKALRLASSWNAIVLIDEADVFLEQRSTNDLRRNGLVSVFLRVLEYFEGIMFLTTNRIGTFDAAFKSRVHLAIKYPRLSYDSRKELWKIFTLRASAGFELGWMNEANFDWLANEDLNGRQIKNIVRTAHALALSKGESMRLDHIQLALGANNSFDQDFEDDIGVEDIERTGPNGHHPAKRRRL